MTWVTQQDHEREAVDKQILGIDNLILINEKQGNTTYAIDPLGNVHTAGDADGMVTPANRKLKL